MNKYDSASKSKSEVTSEAWHPRPGAPNANPPKRAKRVAGHSGHRRPPLAARPGRTARVRFNLPDLPTARHALPTRQPRELGGAAAFFSAVDGEEGCM